MNIGSTTLGTATTESYDYINTIFMNPTVIIIIISVLIIYILIFITIGQSNISSDPVSNSNSSLIIYILVCMFIILIFITGMQNIFNIDVVAKFKYLFSKHPELDLTVNLPRIDALPPVPEILLTPQVFNIPDNNFVYSDAKALCSAYGAKLATYKQVEDSYANGGEWCNYGWSEDQMALFPTQQKTWNGLQKIAGHENDCGRPGVNGGYIANPKVKFGVNCYGFKPRMTSTEETLMETEPVYPKTEKDLAMEHRVNYWKDKLSQVLVSPFNHNSWSKL
jgi:succinate dehydrogenase hydrophobic anchor subunit